MGVDCKTVRIFCVFKYARAVKQKVWNEAENREQNALRVCEARALRARKTLTPRFTDFFTDFEKKTDCFAVYHGRDTQVRKHSQHNQVRMLFRVDFHCRVIFVRLRRKVYARK